jgi:hypothetical protein
LLSQTAAVKINFVASPFPWQASPFERGALVLITLNSPREKFWGAVLDVNPAGISVRGIDLVSFDEITAMLRTDEHVTPATVFFPLNRMERMELDAGNGPIPSLAERFQSKSGHSAARFFGLDMEAAEESF